MSDKSTWERACEWYTLAAEREKRAALVKLAKSYIPTPENDFGQPHELTEFARQVLAALDQSPASGEGA